MKESDKNIEQLIEKMMTEDKLQSPSFDFTSKIMTQVLIFEEKKLKTYKPLISKSVWIFIGAALTALVIYASLFSGTENNLEIGKIYTDKIADAFSGIHFSKNIMYALLIVPFMILIQIGVLKSYFDKKYEL
ncbi:hypothetical protein [Flavobacterium reichenbachii]|uniref:Uncharacterized protein n=1 Tax=Flavobacterium reichenbachii TaxID=362418 RepID=A0A085ZSA0_9FLAO|nr:hypothetical protein [Flavobacterium reichenbachii]KFF07314.1 hypothetical protein IW19_18165 [Flavobacterium reichenbachii]OXB13201.1 hypothetical protein B0A68_15660 [Flavobacterium reichenbachii]